MDARRSGIIAFSIICICSVAAAAAYAYQTEASHAIESMMAHPRDGAALERLKKLHSAVLFIETTYNELSRRFDSETRLSIYERGMLKNELASLSSDADYVFSELDQIRGGEAIKRKRKNLVDYMNKIVSAIYMFEHSICGGRERGYSHY
jgi:hypothetical protein